ncbi:MAG: GDSL-type esterase/lipase family protein [bacterium]
MKRQMMAGMCAAALAAVAVSGALAAPAAAPAPYWLESMKKVNEAFDGNPGYVAQFGDSITYSMAFWSPVGYMEPETFLTGDDGLPKRPERRWRDTIKGIRNKGPEHACFSGWTVGNLLAAVPEVLKRENPEAAILMIGTNDTGPEGPADSYGPNLEKLLKMIMDAHCVPILNTIPPKRGCMKGVEKTNTIIRDLAKKLNVPLVDYYAEILKRQPGDAWYKTLISDDGVHPSAGDLGNFSDENLKVSGYALRTWVNFLAVREVYFRVMSAPKAFKEEVGTVEPIRQGIRCEVTADTQVSKWVDATDDEQIWNWGAAERLKSKGWEEYTLLKFDTSTCKGLAVKKATLYLSRTEQCVINVAGVTTISTDWQEGKGKGSPGKLSLDKQGQASKGGATFTRAIYPETLWAGAGSTFKSAVFGNGGSLWQAVGTGWAKDDKGQDYYSVELPLDIAQALLIDGDTHGLAVADEKGQRQFQSTYRRTPEPNHFLNSRESGKPCFLVIEGEKAPSKAPASVKAAEAKPGVEAGDAVLAWSCPADAAGGKVLGYRVHLSKDKLTARGLTAANRLPRTLTWRPGAPGAKQEFPVLGLEPGADYSFAVVAYDRFGNESDPVIFSGKTREKRAFAMASAEPAKADGAPAGNAALRVWACVSGEKISPLTGNAMSEGDYAGAKASGTYRNGNEAWDGKRQCVTLTAGRNDFAGFQVAIENLTGKPLVGVEVALSGLTPETAFAETARYIRASQSKPAQFQTMIRDLTKRDAAAAGKVFEAVKQFNAYKTKQQNDPGAFFQEMEALRTKDEAEYGKWMGLLGDEAAGAGAGIAAGNVELFWQWNLKDKAGAWYPDALVPLTEALAIPNALNGVKDQKVQALYVDVWVPHKTAPGQYRGDLRIKAAGAEDIVLPVELTVLNYELPDQLNFVCDMNGYQYPPAKDWEGSINLHRLAHRNRLNINMVPYSHGANWIVPQMEMEARGKGKNMRVASFEQFDRCFGPLLNGTAFAKNPRAGVPVPALFLGIYENWPCTLADGFKFDQTAQHTDIRNDFTQDYKDGVVAVCRQMAEHFKQKGYTRTAFQPFLNDKYQYAPETTFWLLDEPMFRDDYLVIQLFGDLVREGFKGCEPVTVDFRIDCSRVEESRGMMNKVDTMVFSQGNIREYPTIAREFMRAYEPKAPGQARKGWEYGGAGAVSQSPVSLRGWAIECWLDGRDGLLPWLAYGGNDAWDSAEAAENAVFYPAFDKWEYNGCYGSLRMKGFRDGQQDAECLILLAKKLGATRSELCDLIKPYVELKGQVAPTGGTVLAEGTGTISYRGLTPDALSRLRRAIGLTLAGGK